MLIKCSEEMIATSVISSIQSPNSNRKQHLMMICRLNKVNKRINNRIDHKRWEAKLWRSMIANSQQ
uniref:Uncharacterized protein n=1 Tax=Arion vulgaris TaxID=1028688 RepID=A0A0B6ZLW6_9EUPU